MDFFLVALIIIRSLDMFRRFLGTRIPFTLIFASTYLTRFVPAKPKQSAFTPMIWSIQDTPGLRMP
jgi:hypothetical protein